MDSPKNRAGELTEIIMMSCFSQFKAPERATVGLKAWQYNRIYSEIYEILRKEFNN